MGVVSTIGKLIVYSLAIVGLVALAFVVLSYGWDGEPPEVSIEAEE